VKIKLQGIPNTSVQLPVRESENHLYVSGW